jgi:LPS export ABC transporter permease LptG/LPS export ABC transporter permease LptF
MRILGRAIFREVFTSALLGTLLFVFVLFLRTFERLLSLLVKTSAPPEVVAKLLLYALPSTIPFALPLGVLVGILIGLSRMSTDSEITAMRAAGISSRSVAKPVLVFALLALIVTALASLWLTPLSLHLESVIARSFAAAQLTGDIESRIFNEQFPDTVVYVNDVSGAGKQVVWHQVFMADVTPPDKLQRQGKDRGEGPRIIVAEEAIPHPDAANNRIILDMRGVRTSERDKEGQVITTAAPEQVEALQAQKPEELQVNKTVQELDTWPLYKRVYRHQGVPLTREQYVDAAVEFHQRFALPLACLLLALVGIPLGISSRKGGKSAALILTVLIAFTYYMAFISLIGLAKKGSLPVPLAVWTPDFVFSIIGILLLLQLERPGDRDLTGWVRNLSKRVWGLVESTGSRRMRSGPNWFSAFRRFGLRPMLVDAYVLNGFLFYFGVLLVALLALIEVFTFFELLGDMIKNDISMGTMLAYLWNLAPKLIYDLTPIGTLVASLICFGILTKYNEVTAFKAGGVSVHRLAAPVLFASLVISGLLFTFDHYYIPDANRRQEMLRAEIKKKPVQTYLDPNRQWIFGEGSRIYNYQALDPHQAIMSKVNVYELDPKTYHVVHQISAERARWEPALKTWIFQNGVSQNLHAQSGTHYTQFYGKSATFPELTEKPSWFVKEEKEYKEMNFSELGQYIRELKAEGMETTPLQVQYYKKFSVPLFALIMAILSIPFAFVAGNRGAMTGVGISFGIAMAYWIVSTLFQQFGDLNQLPAAMAAWAPDLIFSLAGLYFMARMKT